MPSHARVSCEDAKKLIDNRSVTVVDIRDERSFTAGHIVQATLLDNAGLASFLEATDQTVPVIVCCYHGNMSQSGAAFLAERGFQEVYSLDGGFSAWSMQYPADCEVGR